MDNKNQVEMIVGILDRFVRACEVTKERIQQMDEKNKVTTLSIAYVQSMEMDAGVQHLQDLIRLEGVEALASFVAEKGMKASAVRSAEELLKNLKEGH